MEGGIKRFEFWVDDSIRKGYYALTWGRSLSFRVTFPSGSASRREVKKILVKHARELMQKYPEIKEIRIR